MGNTLRDKRIEQLAEEILEEFTLHYSKADQENLAGMIRDSLRIEQTEGEWVSVYDMLPDSPGKYLVTIFGGRVVIGNLIDYYQDGNLSFDDYRVTHWMPLPEPPKMKGASNE